MLYADRTSVRAVEAKNGGERAVTPIAEFTELSDFGLNRTGEDVFFLGTIGQKSGLWEMKLR